MTKKRHTFIVEERGDSIAVTANGAVVYACPTAYTNKRGAASLWGKRLKQFFYEFGQLSELRIRLRNGRLSDPRSFGKDPRRTKG